VKVVAGKSGLKIKADDDSPDDREWLEDFVKKSSPDLVLAVAEVTHKSDLPEGPTEIRIDWQAKA